MAYIQGRWAETGVRESLLFAETTDFHLRWTMTRISEYKEIIMRETANQVTYFLWLDKNTGVFLRVRQDAVYW
jgi:hypothetical protein